MDMQNVSNLQIPEGAVRTIHDKNNRLIWGCLAYDTKYAGNTFQQTYTGKNLWGGYTTYARTSSSVNFSTNSDGTIAANGTASAVAFSATGQVAYQNGAYIALSAGTYYLSTKESVPSGVTVQIVETTNSATIKDGLGSFTLSATTNIVVRLKVASGTSFPTTTTIYPMIEAGNTATDYEPYVGGTPAPNPDYPQDIHVVTGSQSITFSDGVNSQSYPVDLGSVELAKIGTFQDYIYKSGGDWYVHKNCGKVIFNGTENWSLSSNYTNNSRFTCQDVIARHPSPSPILSNYFTEGVAGTDTQNICVNGSTGKVMVTIANSKATTVPGLTTWLSAHNTTVYYVLTASTDTKITDATLISQLNAIHQFLTRYGYDATVSGNLPLIVDKTNL